MSKLIAILLGIILGLVGYFGLTYFNINVNYLDYKYSFKKNLKNNMKFFLWFSVLAGIIALLDVILIGKHLELITLILSAVFGFAFSMVMLLLFSVWVYFSFKTLKTEGRVVLSALVFCIVFLLLGFL